MSPSTILFLHDSEELRARAVAAFSGLPVHLAVAADPAAAATAARERHPHVVVADVASARAAAAFAEGLAPTDGEHPGLVLLASFQAEPVALQARALALLAPPPSPAEASDLLALVADGPGSAELRDAVRLAQGLTSADEALATLRRLGDGASPAVATWARYHAAALLLQLGRLQDALEELSALADERPAFWRAHERLAAVWSLAGDPASAEHHRVRAAEILARLRLESDEALEAHPEAWEGARGAAAPAAGPSSPPSAAAAGPGPSRLEAADIIVADDSELVREMLAQVLREAGYSVRLAESGTEALDLARQRRPDLMILDGLMPGKNGFETCKEVKQSLFPDDPPRVVIFSAIYTKQRQRSEALALYKVDEVLAKPTDRPLDDAELLATVRRHLPA